MNRFSRHRLRRRLSILMVVALLWSQVALAAHPLCAVAALALPEIAVAAAAEHGCHQPPPSSDLAICNAHCSQGDQSSDVGRVPPVPALAPALAVEFSAMLILEADRVPYVELPPPVSWHRPTAHPASLLLI